MLRHGEPADVISLEDIPVPEPGPGQVRARVEAAALNLPDVLLSRGIYQLKPELPFTPGLEACGTVVAVFGHPGRVAGLPSHLPTGWAVRRPKDLDDVDPDDIVLFSAASVADVTMARAVLPRRTRVVALVDQEAPAELVAGVLTAGADVCVRGGQPAILASHLVACRRRQLADRWVALQSAAQELH